MLGQSVEQDAPLLLLVIFPHTHTTDMSWYVYSIALDQLGGGDSRCHFDVSVIFSGVWRERVYGIIRRAGQ